MLKALVGSFAAFLATLFLSAASDSAQEWPNRPITILMGFPAGSGVDVARMLQPSLEESPKWAETVKAVGGKIA